MIQGAAGGRGIKGRSKNYQTEGRPPAPRSGVVRPSDVLVFFALSLVTQICIPEVGMFQRIQSKIRDPSRLRWMSESYIYIWSSSESRPKRNCM